MYVTAVTVGYVRVELQCLGEDAASDSFAYFLISLLLLSIHGIFSHTSGPRRGVWFPRALQRLPLILNAVCTHTLNQSCQETAQGLQGSGVGLVLRRPN